MKQLRYIFVIMFLLLLIINLFAQENLTILHWNDFHSQNKPYYITKNEEKTLIGGYATLAGYINKMRGKGRSLTPKGTSFLDNTAYEVKKKLIEYYPEIQNY